MAIPQDALVDSVDVDFEEVEEHWNVYQLKDGTKIKVKLILRGVKRLNKYEPDGTPVYVTNTINVVRAVEVPDSIKAKPKDRTFSPV
jgi:hypothetical protein